MFNFHQTVELTPARKMAAERDSILSTCAGAMGDVTLTDSAVIILYATMLGANDMFSLVTMAVLPLFNGIFIIPMACVASKFGNQGLILLACSLAFSTCLMIVAAPFFGNAAVPVMIAMLMMFAIFQTGYISGWFPLLDSFLSHEQRSDYLSKMRFWWQFSAAAFIFLIGAMPRQKSFAMALAIGAVDSDANFCWENLFHCPHSGI